MTAAELDLPPVLFLDDLARVLRTSRRTLEKLRRHNALPVAELPGIDKRARFSRDAVQRYLAGQRSLQPTMRLMKGQR